MAARTSREDEARRLLDVTVQSKDAPSSTNSDKQDLRTACVVLTIVQLIFGVGSVVGKLATSSGTNPVWFAFLREAIASLVFIAMLFLIEPPRRLWGVGHCLGKGELRLFLGAGVSIFGNQLCFIVGLSLATSTLATAWQPSQPCFTMLLAVMLGWEKCGIYRSVGLALAVVGAVGISVYPALSKSGRGALSGDAYTLAGCACFAANCFSTSMYVCQYTCPNAALVYPTPASSSQVRDSVKALAPATLHSDGDERVVRCCVCLHGVHCDGREPAAQCRCIYVPK